MRTLAIDISDTRVERFWAKVERRGPDDCWPWTGETQTTVGYGIYSEWADNKRSLRRLAHRMSLQIAGVEIDGLVVRHDCDNPPCVNPRHLRTGTQSDNIQDAIDRRRLNSSGLAIGQGSTWPPRPCRRCGVTVSEGRKRYCPTCRVIVTRANGNAAAQARRRGLTPKERAELTQGNA